MQEQVDYGSGATSSSSTASPLSNQSAESLVIWREGSLARAELPPASGVHASPGIERRAAWRGSFSGQNTAASSQENHRSPWLGAGCSSREGSPVTLRESSPTVASRQQGKVLWPGSPLLVSRREGSPTGTQAGTIKEVPNS